MRCSKITEAIVFVRKIIKMIITREKLMMEAIDSDSKERTFENYNRLLDLTIRIFKMIERLQDENHNLRRPFIYKNENYKDGRIVEMKFLREKIERQFNQKVERYLNGEGQIEVV